VADKPSREDVLLAVALGSAGRGERRVLPDRRSGIDRRKTACPPATGDRRPRVERREKLRRNDEAARGGLLARARERLRVSRRGS